MSRASRESSSAERWERLRAPQARHRLQPDWKSGSHRERFEAVKPYVEGRSVIDIGAASGCGRPDWMHAHLTEVAKEVVGIDLNPELIARARELGYPILEGDAATLELPKTFEVAFAGELIEHIANPGNFLESLKRLLGSAGLLVLTTPNAFRITNFLYRLGKSDVRVNADHVCWYCDKTLPALLDRSGYEVVYFGYVPHTTPGRLRGAVSRALRRMLPERLAWNTLLVVARVRAADAGA